jgi:arylsulfatase A-like enzyme
MKPPSLYWLIYVLLLITGISTAQNTSVADATLENSSIHLVPPFPGDCNANFTGYNVILITFDDTRYDHMGFNGYSRNITPNIDILAEQSTIFTRAYTNTPWTTPSLASILTGLLPCEHGLRYFDQRLDESTITLPMILSMSGYYNVGYVSHFLITERHRFHRGFDIYDYSVLLKGNPHKITTSKELSDRAIQSLENITKDENRTGPFFMWVHYFDAHDDFLRHSEFDFGPKYVDMYDSEIAFQDNQVGRFLNKIDESGIKNKTIIVVTADHGEEFFDHGWVSHGHTLYEETVRIPLFIYVPGFKPEISDAIVTEIQITPTLLSMLSVYMPPNLKNQTIPYSGCKFEPYNATVYFESREFSNLTGILDNEYKLVQDNKRNSTKLFNLGDDPMENKNILPGNQAIAAILKNKMDSSCKLPSFTNWLFEAQNKIYYEHYFSATNKSAPRYTLNNTLSIDAQEKPKISEETLLKLQSLGYIQ